MRRLICRLFHGHKNLFVNAIRRTGGYVVRHDRICGKCGQVFHLRQNGRMFNAMQRNASDYARFHCVHFQDGEFPQESPSFESFAVAKSRFDTLKAQSGVVSCSLFGWLPSGEPHLLLEWDRDGDRPRISRRKLEIA